MEETRMAAIFRIRRHESAILVVQSRESSEEQRTRTQISPDWDSVRNTSSIVKTRTALNFHKDRSFDVNE